MGLNSCNKSEHQKRKALTIFQIACCNINKGTIKTPLHLVMGRRTLRAYVLTCQRALRALRASVPCVLCVATCSRAITTNNNNKFSITCFPYIFVMVLCFCFFPMK